MSDAAAARAAGAAPEATRPAGFRPELEGLRGLAVLVVVLFHAGLPGFGGGFVGVDVFFVLSGYLITRLLLREVDAQGQVDLAAFYARRARRLVPAALVAVLATGLLFRGEAIRADALSALAYVSNLHFISAAHAYFDPGVAHSPLLHTWSLGVEAQFYVVWPFLVTLRRRWFVWLAAGLALASLALAVALTFSNQPLAFYGAPTRVWEFAIGALLVIAPPPPRPALWAAAGLAVLAAVVVLLSPQTPYPGWAAIAPAVGAGLVVAGGAGLAPVLAWGPLTWLGRISYSLYLWHWPLIVLAKGEPLRVGLAVLAAVALAWASLRLVELPVRRSRALARPLPALLAAAAGTAAVAGTLFLLTTG